MNRQGKTWRATITGSAGRVLAEGFGSTRRVAAMRAAEAFVAALPKDSRNHFQVLGGITLERIAVPKGWIIPDNATPATAGRWFLQDGTGHLKPAAKDG